MNILYIGMRCEKREKKPRKTYTLSTFRIFRRSYIDKNKLTKPLWHIVNGKDRDKN
jgi:hypothetical protein